MSISNATPVLALDEKNLIPVSDHLKQMADIPPSRMFLINKSLKVYVEKNAGAKIFDASQGDGGASLPGTPKAILERALQLQLEHGTAYDMPFGTEAYRKAVIEQYWKLDSSSGWGPANVLGTAGGRDALVKVYGAMLALGHGRQGDLIMVSRVPWISYNWGPYGVGANVLWAPGDPAQGWAYSEDAIRESVKFAESKGRKIAGIVITNPDNPTGLTIAVEKQVSLAKAALEAGVAFVLFDWMYHYVTDESPMDLNSFLKNFTPEERKRLMFLDGITKSLGGSNIRNCHLIADEAVIKFIMARASHGVIPSFYSLAVAMAAYEMGFTEAAKTIIEPTNASRAVLKKLLAESGMQHIIGKGYYAFMNVGEFIKAKGWADSEPLGQYLAENHGVAIVPGAFFSPFGGDWIRFSYATPTERTEGAFKRLVEGLESLKK
ncbi:MAG TPA: pyridoxal phosphate-dependent aminotransferase [Anaerolineales bacterium]|nr:pyridoxal phosphate-dependent aminotransferase [Anaerolineales bacterium]HMX18842.1 pyridoxal phosphate-dependent aminotransferase [Anaerolineales bacterium]HMX74994.1 pyridoxal phosphate-dependent aminotransferase [Anaerolineales bacterium]HMZ43666.1 pyridoxal phosphate-dependent aminotransferase [Anaerolineales bacterium]HNA55282.1 pyridoxal phosphate-dependent aminotransferase [Anaerolineales bacterium]